MALHEVITTAKDGTRPFGIIFAEKEHAEAYLAHMQGLGFDGEVSPEIETPLSFADALRWAASYYPEVK